MTAARLLAPVRHVVVLLHPAAGHLRDLAGEHRDPPGDLDEATPIRRPPDLARLVVEARRGRDRVRDPVERDVGEELVLGEAALDVAVAVRPSAEFLDDPGRQPDRRVLEAVADRLRLRALDLLVARARAPE